MNTLNVRNVIPTLMASLVLLMPIAAHAAELPAAAKQISIAGIKLGMSFDDAMAAVSRYSPKARITKYYLCTSDAGVAVIDDSCPGKQKVMPIVQIRANVISEAAQAEGYGETIMFMVSPQTHRVTAVTMGRQYGPFKRGSTPVIQNAILSKFPAGSVRFGGDGVFQIGYFVDRDGNSLNDDITKYNHGQTGDANQQSIELFIQNAPSANIVSPPLPDGGISFAAGTSGGGDAGILGFGLCLVDWDAMEAAYVAQEKLNKINVAAKDAALAKQTRKPSF